jgi:hypothetical protein
LPAAERALRAELEALVALELGVQVARALALAELEQRRREAIARELGLRVAREGLEERARLAGGELPLALLAQADEEAVALVGALALGRGGSREQGREDEQR